MESNESTRREAAVRAMSTSVPRMTPSRPYLLRAMHEWIADNGLTPQIVVDAQQEQVRVPAEYVRDGKIVLNVSHAAVRGLRLGNECVEFSARFGGKAFDVVVPTEAVLAIMARENGTGMSFPDSGGEPPGSEPQRKPEPSGRPNLKVVK